MLLIIIIYNLITYKIFYQDKLMKQTILAVSIYFLSTQ